MALRINTNVSALNAHKNLVKNDNGLSASLEKLSSGLRINKAADDASGMAIADALRSQGLGLGQAIRNANDGISMVQTADGALEESINIVNTIKTKAIQAAQDGQTTDSRKAIQADVDKLMAELDIIAKTTAFNGQKLLSGAFTDKKFQIGAYSGETVGISIGSSESTKTGHLTTAQLTADNAGDVRLTITSSIQDLEVALQSVTLAYNNDAQNGMGALADAINKVAAETGVTAQTDVAVTSNAAVADGTTSSDFGINGIVVGELTVKANDSNGALVNAINTKSDQHGVTASVDAGGFLTLTSTDGRAIQVDGNTGTALAGSDMNTFGSIKLFQVGANEIKVTDEAETVSLATTANVDLGAAATTITDSVLSKDSVLMSGTVMTAGTEIGFVLDTGDLLGANGTTATTQDTILTAGSIIGSSSQIEEGTTVGGTVITSGTVTTSTDSLLKTGSILLDDSVLGAGTTVTTRTATTTGFIEAGTTLLADATLSGATTLLKDMSLGSNSTLASGSSFTQGSSVGVDFTLQADATMTVATTLGTGSIITSGSTFQVGSTLGLTSTLSAGAGAVQTVITDMNLKAGSTLTTGSELAEGSTIGGNTTISGASTLSGDMTLAAGTQLASSSTIKAGTVLTNDLWVAGGNVLAAGTVLEGDAITSGTNYLNNSMTLASGSILNDTTVLAAAPTSNSGATATTTLEDVEKFTLSDVNVTTQDDAQVAISIADSALKNLDKIRSDLGSTQNQLTSTIANISVTRVNIFAAESNIRDVDFADESSNFSRMQILVQASTFALSQANASSQNVLSLLQG